MPDAKTRHEENYRPPLLNGLIIVTLVTIVVALGYLGNYYLGGPGARQTTWYPLSLNCSPFERHCEARVGLNDWIGMRVVGWREGEIELLVDSRGIDAERFDLMLESRSHGTRVEGAAVERIDQQRFRLFFPSQMCLHDRVRLRIELVVTTPQRRVGSWNDFDTPCPVPASAMH